MKLSIRHIIPLLLALSVVGCKNLCKRADCGENGYCYDGECICEKWYSGENCDLAFNSTYEGLYVGTVNATTRSNSTKEIMLMADGQAPNAMLIEEFNVRFEFDSDSSIVIKPQSVEIDSESRIIAGTGSYSLEHIEFQWSEFDSHTAASNSESPKPTFVFIGDRVVNTLDQ